MERITGHAVPIPHSPEPDDLPLIQAAQAEPEAFGLIYQRYADRVFSYTRSRLATVEDASDVTQQIFARALQALPRYRPGSTPFAAWLFRIAANAVTDELRRRRRPTVALQFLPESLEPPAPTTDDAEHLQVLRDRIAELSEREREVLALRFAAGLTAREIGTTLGRSEAAVQKQLSRTLSKLKEQYRAEDSLS